MMKLLTLLPLAAVFCGTAETTTTTARLTTPKEYPPETGRPSNMKYCPLNANTILPWVVGVWDHDLKQFAGIGSMITYIAFVTTCRQYGDRPRGSYKAVGQFIWNVSLPEQPCMQTKIVTGIYKHPKCVEIPPDATFYDFSVMRMVYGWDITGPSWPTVGFANTPYELLVGIRYINLIPNTTGCILSYFRNQQEQPPVFDFDSFVESIPFNSQCVKLLCEKQPPNQDFSKICEKRLGERAKGTMLCMINKKENTIHFGNGPHPYWYAGTPLVCNGTAYGMAAQAKVRNDFPQPNSHDIHFIVTFLRVWPWLMEQRKNHSAPWVRHFYIEDMKLKPVAQQTASDAALPAPSQCATLVIPILYYYSFIIT